MSFTKGCYIGQETVARLHYKGRPNRHLRLLALNGPVSGGEAVSLDGREIGTIGTAVLSPAPGPSRLRSCAGRHRRGTKLPSAMRFRATVVELPFER